jgi:hypothetical protein
MKLWEDRMKMILNEYRLHAWQKEAQELVRQAHWKSFSSAEGAALPPGFCLKQTKYSLPLAPLMSSRVPQSILVPGPAVVNHCKHPGSVRIRTLPPTTFRASILSNAGNRAVVHRL